MAATGIGRVVGQADSPCQRLGRGRALSRSRDMVRAVQASSGAPCPASCDGNAKTG